MTRLPDAHILAYARTPFGKRARALKDWRPDDLAAHTMDALLERSGVAGRRLCGSSQQAAAFAAAEIRAGDASLLVAGGVESMTRVPIASDAGEVNPRLAAKGWDVHQGEGAERIADKWGIPREELDAFALRSHRRAVAAADRGFLEREIVPVPLGDADALVADEGPRRDTSPEALAALKPVFRPDGRITAGNSSSINDGAAMLLLGTLEKADELGLRPLAKVLATEVVGSDPALVLTGPIAATRRVLRRTGLSIGDIDVFECNEAFAPVVLAWQRELGIPPERVNPNGGAIALGHPLGASGARLLMTAANQLQAAGGRRALVTMCIGSGQGIATVLERA